MRTVLDERSEMRNHLEKDISNLFDDVSGFLTFVEQFRESNIDGVDFEDVPEDLGDEIFSSCFGNDIRRPQRFNPRLLSRCQQRTSTIEELLTSRRYSISRTKSRSV